MDKPNHPDFCIGPEGPADRQALRQLFLETRQSTFHWLDTSGYGLLDFDEQTHGERIFVAKVGNQVAGFVSLWMPDNFIHHLFVDQRFQRQQIGLRLLEVALRELHVPIALKCLEQNSAALAFYGKHGFVTQSQGTSAEGSYFLMVCEKS
ncbi:GNAT family N-acetyltransferase [Flavobacterium sp.]|uniref:GNAT family N-acetyltransferase n=1 Tax=Flavobacterium sp. TaxID=239 RepID=UPI0039E61769